MNISAVAEHARNSGHAIDWSNTTVVDREPDWHHRGIKEAIHISLHPQNLNRDEGRYHLPPIYRTLLRGRVTDPSVHQSDQDGQMPSKPLR